MTEFVSAELCSKVQVVLDDSFSNFAELEPELHRELDGLLNSAILAVAKFIPCQSAPSITLVPALFESAMRGRFLMPRWAKGLFCEGTIYILMDQPQSEFAALLSHELFHHCVAEYYQGGETIADWFNELVAHLVQGGNLVQDDKLRIYLKYEADRVKQILLSDRLNELGGYSQAIFLALGKFALANFGSEIIVNLLQGTKTQSFPSAFEKAMERNLAVFFEEWICHFMNVRHRSVYRGAITRY